MAMSLPLHSPGTKKSVSYQKSPQYSRDSLSVKKSQKDAGTGMEMDSGRPLAQLASTPSLLASKLKRHMPSRLTTRREVETTGYSRDLLFIAKTSFSYGLPSPLRGEMAEAWTERFGAIIVFWYQYDRFFEKGIEQICNKSRLFSGKLGSFWAEYLL